MFQDYLRNWHLILNMLYTNPDNLMIERLKSFNEIFLLKFFKYIDGERKLQFQTESVHRL